MLVVRRLLPLVLLLALVACSGGGQDPEPPQSAPQEDAEPEPQPEPEPEADEEPAAPSSSLEVTGEVERSDVEIRAAELLTELEAAPEPRGTVVEIPDTVLFDFDSADLLPAASGVLDDVAEVLTLLEDAPAVIRGHTDDVGSDEYNLGLSLQRADAVEAYLVAAGIDPSRITTEGLGSSEPIADNSRPDGSDDPEGRARNRRVEVVLPTVDLDELTGD